GQVPQGGRADVPDGERRAVGAERQAVDVLLRRQHGDGAAASHTPTNGSRPASWAVAAATGRPSGLNVGRWHGPRSGRPTGSPVAASRSRPSASAAPPANTARPPGPTAAWRRARPGGGSAATPSGGGVGPGLQNWIIVGSPQAA